MDLQSAWVSDGVSDVSVGAGEGVGGLVRVTIRPHFPGHVLIFKSYISVWVEFLKSSQMSGNWT